MRLLLLFFGLVLVAATSPPDPVVLTPVERAQVSDEQRAQLAASATLREGLVLDARGIRAARGYSLLANGADCSARGVTCAVLQIREPAWEIVIPFASDGGLGGTRVMATVDRLRLSAPLAAAASRAGVDALRAGADGWATAPEGVRLATSDPERADCSVRGAWCGIAGSDGRAVILIGGG
ncbi:MAG TPA: hypothetical protein EYQ24_17175 [Bacteroidetes bacterium]|nr:hypothetical protein [Bacteroidota bacterium]